jgi:hypothetical protein
LNLFDVYTMAPDGPSTQAAISSDVSPSLFQADFTTSPPPAQSTFVIEGGAEAFGTKVAPAEVNVSFTYRILRTAQAPLSLRKLH